jgi:homoserine kinase
VWCHYEQTGGVIEALRGEADGWADVHRVPFESQGARVTELH